MTQVRIASVLVLVALFVELWTLFWPHPLSFVVFAGAGGLALGAGILVYLYFLIKE
jgi:hypothetical protein